MARTVSILAVLTLLVVPLSLARPATVAAASTMTIATTERGSGNLAPYACYGVRDLDRGGDVAGGCDEDGDGTVVLTTPGDGCGNCRIGQGLPDQPNGQPTEYLLEPDQFGSFSGTYSFNNFLKPYLVVSAVDARSGAVLKGACVNVEDLDRGGGVAGGCDGQPSDGDGQLNGTIETARLPHAGSYRVHQKSPPPPGYVLGPSVDVVADPAQTGEFEAVTVAVPPAPKIVIKTVNRTTGKRLKGACYAIADASHGGGLGTFCDGQRSGTFGDQDGVANGIVVTKPLPVGHTYRLDQKTAPRGYRLSGPDKSVTTVAGTNATAIFKNRPTG